MGFQSNPIHNTRICGCIIDALGVCVRKRETKCTQLTHIINILQAFQLIRPPCVRPTEGTFFRLECGSKVVGSDDPTSCSLLLTFLGSCWCFQGLPATLCLCVFQFFIHTTYAHLFAIGSSQCLLSAFSGLPAIFTHTRHLFARRSSRFLRGRRFLGTVCRGFIR